MQKLLELPDKLFKYLVAAILIIIPLYPKFPLIDVPGIYVSIRFEDVLLLVTGLFIFVKIVPFVKRILRDDIGRAILLFVLIGGISLISGVFVTKTVVPGIGLLHLLRRIEYFLPFLAVLAYFPNEKSHNLEFYIKVLMIVTFLAFVYGLGERYFNFPVINTQNAESSKGLALRWTPGTHINSTFAGHYDLASYIVLILPIFISLFFIVKNKFSKILLALVSLSGFWLLVNAASRISLVSYLFAVFVSLFLLKKYKALIAVALISIILSGFSSNLSARYKQIIEVIYKKIIPSVSAQEITLPEGGRVGTPVPAPIPVFEDRSTSIRINVEWPRAVRAFSKKPLLGTGYSSISLATDNDYLRLLGEVGLLGFLGFILILFRIMNVFTAGFPLTENFSGTRLGFIAGMIGGFMGTLSTAVFIDVFEASKFAIIFWLLIGLAVYTVKERINEDKN